MDIKTRYEIKNVGTEGDAQLVIYVSTNGEKDEQRIVRMSGPKADVEA